MPVIKSAKKKLRADKKRESANKKIEAQIRLSIKKTEKKPTPTNIQESFKIIDKSVKKGIIHKNKGARIKSRLSKLISKKIEIKGKIPNLTKAKKPNKTKK